MDYSRPRSHFLDGLRGFAALYVALHHVYCTIWRPDDLLGSQDLHRPTGIAYYVAWPFFYGNVSVALFIAISGFSLAIPVMRTNSFHVGKFYLRRIWRITPPYYAGLLLSIVLIETLIGDATGSHWDAFNKFGPTDVLVHLGYIQNLFSHTSQTINGAYWSIAIEMQFYILFPLIILAYKMRFLFGVIASWCLMVSLVVLNREGQALHFPGFNTELFELFCMGVCGAAIAYADDDLARWVRSRVPFGWLGIGGILLGLPLLVYSEKAPFLAEVILVGSLVGWMVEDTRPTGFRRPLRIFDNRLLSTIGLFAYSLYLIHEPVEQIIWQYAVRLMIADKIGQFFLLAVMTLILVVPLSYIFFRLFEEPFLDRVAFEKFYAMCKVRLRRATMGSS